MSHHLTNPEVQVASLLRAPDFGSLLPNSAKLAFASPFRSDSFAQFSQPGAIAPRQYPASRMASPISIAASAAQERKGSTMFKTIRAAAILAAAVLASVPALAQDKLPDVRVYYGDLDLSDPAAVRVLDRRLFQAVRASCPSLLAVRELSQRRVITRCWADKHAEIAPQREAALASAAHKSGALAAR
jgi:UrcA family protein